MKKTMYYLTIILGLISTGLFIADYYIFYILNPKMTSLQAISQSQENLMFIVGIGLLIFTFFLLASLLRIVQYLQKAKKITWIYSALLVCGILSLLFVFSDLALLNDISKQYKLGLDQPEWSLIYPIITFQFITSIVLTSFHFFGFNKQNQIKDVAIDNNIFIVAQYVGLFCGLLGLSFTSLGFFFPHTWNLHIHITISSIVLLIPYLLVVFYWFYIKLREKTRQWYDEKQIQDIDKSSFITLISSIIFMTLLFIINYNNLSGIVSNIWLPVFLFFTLTLFSIGNIYFSRKD